MTFVRYLLVRSIHMSYRLLGKIAAAPIMGAAFALFLPFIGFAMVLWCGGQFMLKRVRR